MSAPMTVATGIDSLAAEIIAKSKRTPPRPDPVRFVITAADISDSMPDEYRSAKPLRGLQAALKDQTTILISGPPGTGKTHQLHGLARTWRWNYAVNSNLTTDGMMVDCELRGMVWVPPSRVDWVARTMARIIAKQPLTIISESTDIRGRRFDREWLSHACSIDHWLAIDDIGCIEPDQWVRECLYEIATQRRKRGLKTIWTTNLKESELRSTFGAAIASRLLGGAVFELDGNDRRLA